MIQKTNPMILIDDPKIQAINQASKMISENGEASDPTMAPFAISLFVFVAGKRRIEISSWFKNVFETGQNMP